MSETPFVLISSVLLVQADEGVSCLVVDRIGNFYRNLPRRADVIVTTVGARHKCQQGSGFEPPMNDDICIVVFVLIVSRLFIFCSSAAYPGGGDPDPQHSPPPPPSSPPSVDAARRKSRSDRSGEEIPSMKSSSSFLVQTDEGIGIPVVDRIRRPKLPNVEVPISS
ncbi:protein LUTEIN DEFICIENT 5, chloroplastic [Dorcoceras hygrometricum]|uniref:Protein LUTEIN DEFICIENT 5, chloroplastic n=1 Tax=Dorcoceras hygrometricum TaxID=472368 RepID=A0A2Z7CWJ5_9LAMI|nr:protein LUTEIN DEFICIENT 5, chloroplastic [Dorcoceras hygrometricum]